MFANKITNSSIFTFNPDKGVGEPNVIIGDSHPLPYYLKKSL